MNEWRSQLNRTVENHTSNISNHAKLVVSICLEMQDLTKHDQTSMIRLGKLLKDLSLELNQGIKLGITFNRDFAEFLDIQESELKRIKANIK